MRQLIAKRITLGIASTVCPGRCASTTRTMDMSAG